MEDNDTPKPTLAIKGAQNLHSIYTSDITESHNEEMNVDEEAENE